MTWNYNPEQYSEKNFKPIDEGDYRVRISKAEYKAYASGKACYEVMLDVNGYNSKLWYHIWLDPFDERKTNQKLGEFFHSFGIGGGEYQSFDACVLEEGRITVNLEKGVLMLLVCRHGGILAVLVDFGYRLNEQFHFV